MIRLKDNKVFADQCLVAESVWTRFMGLMGKNGLASGSGLLIRPCNSIHTFFMKFAIDVVYLKDEGQNNYLVVSVRKGVKPWRMDFPVFSASAVLELSSGAAQGLEKGDLLCLS